MGLQVFIAHTGKRLEAEPGTFASLDAFKAWVAKNGSVSVQNQICLTGSGKAVRAQTLLTEQEIFIYNRQILQGSSSNAAMSHVPQIPIPNQYEVQRPPDTISDQNDLEAWRDLFMARRTWALKLVDDSSAMSNTTQERYGEIDVIARAVNAAVTNIEGHVSALDHRFAETQTWASNIVTEYGALLDRFNESLNLIGSLPATSAMIRFIVGRDPREGKQKACLEDLIDTEEVQKAKSQGQAALKHFTTDLAELGRSVDKLGAGMDKVADLVEKGVAASAPQRSGESLQLMEDIEAIAKKVNSDYESVLSYPNTSKSVSQASKTALLHTKNFLPNLSKRTLEMDAILRYATEMRNAAAGETVEVMQGIATLNTMCTEIISKLENFDIAGEDAKAFELLSVVDRLPAIYASFVAEAIRRREWNEKIKSDSSTLANEMASFQDEEERRRKKWQKSTGALFWHDKSEHKVMGLEVNLLGEEDTWPQGSRKDLEELLELLQNQNAYQELITEVSQVISDLNNPTKQQNKRAKAFKAGSIHEAALGRSALLVRGDDDLIRSLQDEKTRVESKLKGAESRVRKLEGLLHQQGQASRVSSGHVFQSPSSPSPDRFEPTAGASGNLNDDLTRPADGSARRFSGNQSAEEKLAVQRLISLEAELIAERERAAGLEKEISVKNTASNDIKGQMEEALSTKKDLMENLEAQQREFATERMALESEIKRLKGKIEDYEDDMDRLLGSRENEKAHGDERARALQNELEKVRSEALAEAQKAQGQVDFLRNDAKLQRESNETLERQLLSIKEQDRDIKSRLDLAEAARSEELKALQNLHGILNPTLVLPGDLSDLVEGLIARSRDVISELDIHKDVLAMVQSDRDTARAQVSDLKTEVSSEKEKLANEEMETFRLRETLGAERAKYSALESQLSDGRDELAHLRAKFADGETGSEALRSRVEDEERKVTKLSEDLASKRSQVGSLEEELRSVQDKLQASQSNFEKLNNRLEVRTLRAKDLTQRLYAQNDRLCRLLDRLSYSVAREGESMIITRIPKQERASANDSSDPGTSMRRSLSGLVPRKSMADSGDLDLLYWMQNDDSEAESEKYEAYINTVGNFDVEAFCETMVKRVKDLEHTARKYTRDARNYREKSHAAQKEAHEKIAYKHFKEGDLALFLPTRNQATGAWAAFNVGAPHYFLREQDSHKLRTRDWLLARIHKIEDRVVDLSKSMTGHSNIGDRGSIGEASTGGDSFEDDNPFDLSDGLRWYLIDATEEKPGAPSTPGLGKSTVATTSVDATGSIRRTKKSSSSGVEGVSRTLSKSLDSRRSSTNSRKAIPVGGTAGSTSHTPAKGPSSLSDAPLTATADPQQPTSSETTPVATTSSTKPGDSALGEQSGASASTKTPPAQLLSATSSNLEDKPSHHHHLQAHQQQQQQQNHNTGNNNNNNNTSTGTSPSKKSMIWDSLWSLDMSLESGKRGSRAG